MHSVLLHTVTPQHNAFFQEYRTQGIYNRPGIECKNGRLEIAARIIDRFYLVDEIFAQFFLLDESCIYSAHVGT